MIWRTNFCFNHDGPDNHDDNSDSDEDHRDRNNLHSKCDL